MTLLYFQDNIVGSSQMLQCQIEYGLPKILNNLIYRICILN